MFTFKEFIEQKVLIEVGPPPGGMAPPPPPPGGGGLGMPGALPGGGAPPPPPGGLGGAPPMGGMGGAPPMGGPPQGGNQAPTKLKAYNVWDVLEKVLGIGQDMKG
jgi:hypothetical protein